MILGNFCVSVYRHDRHVYTCSALCKMPRAKGCPLETLCDQYILKMSSRMKRW